MILVKHIKIFGWLAVYGILFVFLQLYSAYHFYYIEQNQLFQFTWQYLAAKIAEPGGFALWTGEFLVQFFILPYTGAALTAALLCSIGILTERILHRIAPEADTFLLSLFPPLSLLFVHFDFNYQVQGSVAYLLNLAFFYGYIRLPRQNIRLVAGLLCIPLLFWWGGAIALLFAASVVLWEFFREGIRGYKSLFLLAEAIAIGLVSVQEAVLGELRFAFLPDGYYHPNLVAGKVLYASWLVLPLLLIIAYVLRNRKKRPLWRHLAEGSVLLALLGVIAWIGIPLYSDTQSAMMKELDYYTRTRQWDKIIHKCEGPLTNYLYLCTLNMALAEKGELADRAFNFNQRGLQGAIVPWNKSAVVSTLLSEIFFTIGDMALSQEMAFESYLSTPGEGNPRMLQRLVQTNLIYGAYPVAEKYIDLLSHTFYYKKWAEQHRKFLYNDAAVAQDSLLGDKQKNLLNTNLLSQSGRLAVDLEYMIEHNPDNRLPIHYLGLFCLLSKELDTFKNLVEKYYGTPALPTLPVSFQEAILIFSEKNPDYWKRFQLSEPVLRRFMEYKKQVLTHKNNPNALPGLMQRSYGDTYWFYFMFK